MPNNTHQDLKNIIDKLYNDFCNDNFKDEDFEPKIKQIVKNIQSNFLSFFIVLVFTSHYLKSIINNPKFSDKNREKAKDYRKTFQSVISDMTLSTESIDALFVKFL